MKYFYLVLLFFTVSFTSCDSTPQEKSKVEKQHEKAKHTENVISERQKLIDRFNVHLSFYTELSKAETGEEIDEIYKNYSSEYSFLKALIYSKKDENGKWIKKEKEFFDMNIARYEMLIGVFSATDKKEQDRLKKEFSDKFEMPDWYMPQLDPPTITEVVIQRMDQNATDK